MLQKGDGIYASRPTAAADRVFHPATIIDCANDTFTLFVGHEPLPSLVGAEVHLYFDVRVKFMRQVVTITAISAGDEGRTMNVRRIGTPEVVELRAQYRVGTISEGMTCRFGAEERCAITDLSMNGLSVISRETHPIGARLELSFRHDGDDVQGTVEIMNVIPLADRSCRFGLRGVGDAKRDPFRETLRRITMEIQRRQLRRRTA